MEYTGPERRARSADIASDLAEIKTDVKWIMKSLPELATSERVSGVEKTLARHLDGHMSKNGLVASWAGVAVALGVGVLAILL